MFPLTDVEHNISTLQRQHLQIMHLLSPSAENIWAAAAEATLSLQHLIAQRYPSARVKGYEYIPYFTSYVPPSWSDSAPEWRLELPYLECDYEDLLADDAAQLDVNDNSTGYLFRNLQLTVGPVKVQCSITAPLPEEAYCLLRDIGKVEVEYTPGHDRVYLNC